MQLRARWWLYGLLAAALAAVFWFRHSNDAEPVRRTSAPAQIRVDGSPSPDVAAIGGVPDALHESKWLAERSKRYRALLADWQCDVMVVPLQVEGQAFDLASRELMAGQLALAVSAPDRCVADPRLIDLALGEGLRRHTPEGVADLARQLGAKTVISAFAGHDKKGHMRVTLRVERPDAAAPGGLARIAAKSFDDLGYGEEVAPAEAFAANLPRMLTAVGMASSANNGTRPAGSLSADLPQSPKDLLEKASGSLLDRSARLLLLAMLAPRHGSHAAERALVKAWLVLSESPDDAAVQRMRSRILFHLEQRPYALRHLGGLAGAEADALRAVINGDLPAAKAAAEKLSEPWEKLFALIESYDLQLDYERDGELTATAILAALGPEWSALVAGRLADDDHWVVPDLVRLKQALDKTFPIAHESLEDLVKGNMFIGKAGNEAAYDLLASRHVRQLLQASPREWCCKTFSLTLSSLDLLDLFDGRSEAALVQRVAFLEGIQGRNEDALELLSAYDEILAGNPSAETTRAYTEWQLLRGIQGRDARNERIRVAARIAVTADPGQGAAPSSALWYLLQPPVETYAHALGDAYCQDYPIRASWPGMPDTLPGRLAFSSSDIEPLKQLLDRAQGEQRKRLLAELDTRFEGNPVATDLRFDEKEREGGLEPAALREAIRIDAENWKLYARLAELLISRGEFAQASEAARSFPAFARKAQRTVELSNHARSIGNSLYYLGAVDAARPLLKIAADYDNGSQASIISQARLALLDRDYGAAAGAFLRAAQRYDDLSDYRDVLELLFVSGHSQDGWTGFDQLVRRYQGVEPWVAAMIGHRRDGIEREKLHEWIAAQSSANYRQRGDSSVAAYALMEQLTDRAEPPVGFAEFIATLAGPSFVHHSGKTFVFAGPGQRESVIGPAKFGNERRKAPVNTAPKDESVPHWWALFAEAYVAFEKKDYADAASGFDRMASFYDIETNGHLGFVLPYFAMALAQSGDPLALEKHVVQGSHEKPPQWGTQLALAILAGKRGDVAVATAALDTAFRQRPASGSWPISTSYQYAQVCDWLFETTGDARYRERALEWARAHRRIEPVHAWAHALVAKLSNDASERREALAYALYLDPESYWASQAPPAARAAAANWSREHALFRIDSMGRSAQQL